MSLREYYIHIVDRAITFAQTGTVDYYTAMRASVKEMARSGLNVNSLPCEDGWATNEEMVDWIAIQGPKIFKAWKEAGAL